MAAMMTWADPSMAWATGLAGLLSWLAIWAADRPASTCGLYSGWDGHPPVGSTTNTDRR